MLTHRSALRRGRDLLVAFALLSLTSAFLPFGASPVLAVASDMSRAPKVTAQTTTTETVVVVATPTTVRLSGRWTTVFDSRLLGGRAMKSAAYGAALRYSFNGTGISIIGPKSSRGGIARIYVDGHYVKTVSEYSALSHSRVTLFSKSFSTYSKHTITVLASTARFTVNALAIRRPTAPSPSATPRIVTVGPSESVSAFRSLAADLSVDVIEMTSGTYHNWREANLPDRTGHPLTIRPAAGATVVFDAANDDAYPDHAFGLLNASYITIDGTPGRFVFQHYILAQDGMFLLINASHITVKGVTFSNIAGNANSNSESTHLFYVSDGVSYLDIEDVAASRIRASDEPGGVFGVSGIQFYTGGSGGAIHNVTVKNVSISNANWGVVVRNGSYGMLFDGVTTSDCGHGGVPASLDFGTNNTGTVRNSTTTLSVGTPDILGAMTNGGGNTFH